MSINKHLKKIVFTGLFLVSLYADAQDIIVQSGESMGIAGMLTVSQVDGISSIDPSAIAEIEGLAAVEVSHARPFGMSELRQTSAKVAGQTKFANVLVAFARCGDEDSHYTEIGGGLSRKFGIWSMGLEYHALIHTMSDNRRYSSSFSRFGFRLRPRKEWLLSVAIHSIEQREISYGFTSREIEAIAMAGIKWRPNQLCSVMLEAEKRWNDDAIGKVAVAIYPIEGLDVSAGFSSNGSSFSAGAGYIWQGIALHVGIMRHEKLGVSSGVTLSYNLNKSK